ncbi:hypothetical protein [Fusibacter sp. 3D3]|uniref:hypothetical protein n=1 Tax=Fusibacter sp. 3D3 TaxID=1048380 RepID=UPI0008534F44|nr:hypothetical protein [Fusibacter sp. 3D3]GAU75437.1 hypothetical protein F3D3_0023 [Fusibacter sp. 3D3]
MLSEYDGYSSKSSFVKEWLIENIEEEGLWDFTSKTKDGIYFPLSDSWSEAVNRKYDSTYIVLKLIENMEIKKDFSTL